LVFSDVSIVEVANVSLEIEGGREQRERERGREGEGVESKGMLE
jgi:hypothetical protein